MGPTLFGNPQLFGYSLCKMNNLMFSFLILKVARKHLGPLIVMSLERLTFVATNGVSIYNP
jgi:hypothetical protein